MFIESTDMELWKIVNNGPYAIPKIKNDNGEDIDKPKDQYTRVDWEKLTNNSKAKLDLAEFDPTQTRPKI